MHQNALPLAWPPRYGAADYITDECNQAAFAAVNAPHSWVVPVLILKSERNGGKTHLAHIFAEKHAARFVENISDIENFIQQQASLAVIDDADKKLADGSITADSLFHLVNDVTQRNARLLLTACQNAKEWSALPDLVSRLVIMPVITIGQPDENVVRATFQKLFVDRGLNVDDKVLDFLAVRSERSFSAIINTVHVLDRLSLERSRKITVPLVQSSTLFA